MYAYIEYQGKKVLHGLALIVRHAVTALNGMIIYPWFHIYY